MIIVLILGLFLSLTLYVLNALQESSTTRSVVVKVYKKEQGLIFLDSVAKKVTSLLRKDNNNYDALTELWAKPFEFPTPLGNLKITIVDLDRYINLNAVGRNLKLQEVFENLLQLLDIDPLLLQRLLVWEGVKPLEGEWKLPYPIKGKPLDSIYELQLFWKNSKDLYGKKVGNEEYPGLLELVTVHSTGKININTAPYWVLRALSPYIDDVLARQIMEKREEQPFKDVMELLTVDGIDMDLLYKIQDLLTTKSRFFKITLTLEGDNSQTLTVIYDREKNQIVEKSVH